MVNNEIVTAGRDFIEITWERQRWFGKVILIVVAFQRKLSIVANLKNVYSSGKHVYFSAPYLNWTIDDRRENHPSTNVRHHYDIASESELIGIAHVVESPFKKNHFVVNEPVLL